MKLKTLIVMTILVTGIFLAGQDNEIKPSYALVVGVKDYPVGKLHNTVNDANSLESALTNLGFRVTKLLNPKKKELEQAIREFGKNIKDKNSATFFYYSGHGIQAHGKNYLIPVDANLEKEQDIEYEAVDLERVMSDIEYGANPVNVVILDACRNNPFAKSFRSGGEKGLAVISKSPAGTMISYATAPARRQVMVQG